MAQIYQIYLLVLSLVPAGQIEYGKAYRFSAVGDPWNPVPYAACLKRDLNDKKDIVIAHRTLPCKSKVLLHSVDTGRSVIAIVGDRGPYGKNKKGYRGIVDMAPQVDKQLKTRGESYVILIPLSNIN